MLHVENDFDEVCVSRYSVSTSVMADGRGKQRRRRGMRTLSYRVMALVGLTLVCLAGTGCTIYLEVPPGYLPSTEVPTGHLAERKFFDV